MNGIPIKVFLILKDLALGKWNLLLHHLDDPNSPSYYFVNKTFIYIINSSKFSREIKCNKNDIFFSKVCLR